MFFRQVLHEDLGCASYVLADVGEAVVIDPKWEIEVYLDLAAEQELAIKRVLETHNHADHLSGTARSPPRPAPPSTSRAMPASSTSTSRSQTATRSSSATSGSERSPRPATDPEHMAFLVEDGSRADRPWFVLTGDALFVGDVGRPDLAVDPDEGARGLFRSTRRLLELDNDVELWVPYSILSSNVPSPG
jgi:glyoxylase-like metal-dependent hydrolase (beta-lactamase superfamily II)